MIISGAFLRPPLILGNFAKNHAASRNFLRASVLVRSMIRSQSHKGRPKCAMRESHPVANAVVTGVNSSANACIAMVNPDPYLERIEAFNTKNGEDFRGIILPLEKALEEISKNEIFWT